MPRIPDERPRAVVLQRGDTTVSVGDGGDLTWDDVDALTEQIARRELHDADGCRVAVPLPIEHVAAIIAVKRTLGGSIEDWRDHERARRWTGAVKPRARRGG